MENIKLNEKQTLKITKKKFINFYEIYGGLIKAKAIRAYNIQKATGMTAQFQAIYDYLMEKSDDAVAGVIEYFRKQDDSHFENFNNVDNYIKMIVDSICQTTVALKELDAKLVESEIKGLLNHLTQQRKGNTNGEKLRDVMYDSIIATENSVEAAFNLEYVMTFMAAKLGYSNKECTCGLDLGACKHEEE